MGVDDRFWEHISALEARAVLGEDAEIVAGHRRWLFAVARCRTRSGDLYLKRQPPMGRDIAQVEWQHALGNHLADRGVPAARALRVVDLAGLWYEVHEPAAGDDVYAEADRWDPFASDAHVASAAPMLARLPPAGADFSDRPPQRQAGFVVQLGAVAREPADALARLARRRPAVADYLEGRGWEAAVEAAYASIFDRLRPLVDALPERPLHGDWQTNNLFFAGDEVAGIIDFHQADYAPRLLDLAVAVERNCFFWNRISAGDDTAFDLAHAAALVGAYDAVAPLMPAERAAFADVLQACQFEYNRKSTRLN